MRLKIISPWSKDFATAKKLYTETFPPEDRVPLIKIIGLITLRSTTKFWGLYENDKLCGFTLTVCSKRYLYINFIAIDPAYRSLGYGSRLLTLLKRRYHLPIIALVRLPEYETPEYDLNLRRVRFWQRAGMEFFHYQYIFTEPSGVHYAVGVIQGEYDRDAFQEILDLRSFHPAAILRNLRRKFMAQPSNADST